MYTAIILAGVAAIFAGFLSLVEGEESLGLVMCFFGILAVITGIYAMWFNEDHFVPERRRTEER